MQTWAGNHLKSRSAGVPAVQPETSATKVGGLRARMLVLAAMLAAVAWLQGCSGSSSSFTPSTSTNPAPGVTLQSIQIAPSTSLISISENRQLYATGIYSDGSQADLTSQVKWASNSSPSTTSYVAVSSSGVATGSSVGSATITATLGSVVGVLQLTGYTNGFASNTLGILSAPFKSTVADMLYLAEPSTQIQGSYAVQEVNLDADQFSTVLPVESALLSSIPMPAGFVPNATIANQSNALVAVISYTSPDVQIIDASNLADDLTNNTVIATYKSPVTQSVTTNGIKCMICGAVINPLNGELLLSTAQGYYYMDFTTGAFTAIPFTPAPVPTENFALNPLAGAPFILAPDTATGNLQILDLTTNAVTTVSSGLPAPSTAAIDVVSGYGAVVDDVTNNQTALTLTPPQSPVLTPISGIGVCGTPIALNMVTMGVSAGTIPTDAQHTLFLSQTSGNCVGMENPWPGAGQALDPADFIGYYYGPMPNATDGSVFVNGNDPNAIATFNSVVSKSDFGLLVSANQQWVARLNMNQMIGDANQGTLPLLPAGTLLPPTILCTSNCFSNGTPQHPVVFLPSPSTAVTLSVNNISFGSLSVGTTSPLLPVTLSDIGLTQIFPQISLAGANPGDFGLNTTCVNVLLERSTCSINVYFTPTATGTRSAVLNVSYSGGPTQTVALSGTGQ